MTQRLVSRRGSLFFAGALAPARQTRLLARVLTAAVAIIISFAASLGPVIAQPAPPAPPAGILTDGDAAVTGFSGVQPPTLVAPGVDPADKTSIDLAGPSARVIDLDALGAPPQAQLIQATKPFTATAAQVGQVFAVALDNASPPNIYVAATSAYGLPIVVPDKDGDGLPDRIKQGAPNASFMPGLFGPADQSGGPGSIWRIDGVTREVRLFANVTLDGAPNSGPALGGLAFDPASNSLFVADRETGMIHRFDLDGKELGRYDHSVQERPVAGLPPVPFNPANRLDITKPQFQTANPATWAYAPPPRRIFGLAVREGRLYYAVAEGLQIWSVGITANAFGTDARREITVPPGQSASEIAKIAFDDQGRMLLAERVASSGAFDFGALTEQGAGRVLRYSMAPSPTGPVVWSPDQYAIMRNSNGGVAIGYGYGPDGGLDRNACGGFVWASGEQLRVSADPALAAQLAQGGPPNVNGLQGNGIDLVRPASEPPLQSYFVDYDDRFEDPNARGHLGDIAILRFCARAVATAAPGAPPAPSEPAFPTVEPGGPFGPWLDGWPPLPPPICPVGTHLATNALQCCPPNQIPGFTGACQSPCPNGSMIPADMIACRRGFQPGNGPDAAHGPAFVGLCWNGAPVVKVPGPVCAVVNNLACNKCPKSPLEKCPSGTTEVAGVPPPAPAGLSWEWSDRHCVPVAGPACPPGQQKGLDGLCHVICPAGQTAYPVNRCCLNGTAPNALGQCPFGMLVPPLWYLHYLATGTGPCVPPNCSFFEFTVTGQERFGRGSLTQRITLPPGSAFPEARVTRGSKYCPASAWSCSKAGDVFTCSAEDCGLAPGDQVVVRLEGKVAPELTQPPPAPIEKTACGVLEWQAMPGPGPAVIEQPGEARRMPSPPQREQRTAAGVVTPSKQACWTIRVVGKAPIACPPNYVATANGQCCLRDQITAGGVCCPAGQRPDSRRRSCVAITSVTPSIIEVPPPERPCALGRHWDGRRCVPDLVGPCPPGQHRAGRQCVPDRVISCPPGQHRVGRRCVPDRVIGCPPGQHRVGGRCVSSQRVTPPLRQRVTPPLR